MKRLAIFLSLIFSLSGSLSAWSYTEGVYTLVARYPVMAGILDRKIVVIKNKTVKTQIIFEDPKDRRMAHNTTR